MDCEYILKYGRVGTREEYTYKFHAGTPEDAVETAKEIIRHQQRESVQEFPFAPPVVKGELYRQMQVIYGQEFIEQEQKREEEKSPDNAHQ